MKHATRTVQKRHLSPVNCHLSARQIDILYLFPGPEVALRAGGGQRPHELHASLSQPCKDVVIPGKRNWEAVRMTQFRFYDVTIPTA
jgi:hypothetical protein